MRKRMILALLALWLAAPCTVVAQESLPPLEIYLIDPCGGCAGGPPGCGDCTLETELAARYRALLAEAGQADRPLQMYNVRREPERYGELRDRLLTLGIDAFDLPVALTEETVFPADGTGDEALLAFLTVGEAPPSYAAQVAEAARVAREKPARSILYLSSEYCEDCKRVDAWLARSLPKDVVVEKYSIATQEGMLLEQAVHLHYDTGEEARYVPLIVYGDHVLVGREQIMLALLSRMEEDPGAETPSATVLMEVLP